MHNRTTRLKEDKIYVLDDVISKAYQNLIENTVLSNKIEYHFENDIGHINNREGGNFGFGNTVRSEGSSTSEWDNLFLPMVHEAMYKINRDIAWIKQGRVFLITSGVPNKQDVYHIDCPMYHIVLLYYVNDSDGDTILTTKIDDEKLNVNGIPYSDFFDYSDLEIYKRITPKKGRLVIFNGLRYHCSSRPSKGKRAVVNYNVL